MFSLDEVFEGVEANDTEEDDEEIELTEFCTTTTSPYQNMTVLKSKVWINFKVIVEFVYLFFHEKM